MFLPYHTDQDFTMSIVNVLIMGNDKYELNNDVVVFFCFPTLGVAVPLHPGDFLFFNALIHHCLSSQCKEADNIFILSM